MKKQIQKQHTQKKYEHCTCSQPTWQVVLWMVTYYYNQGKCLLQKNVSL
jgi:hypothetical protein